MKQLALALLAALIAGGAHADAPAADAPAQPPSLRAVLTDDLI